jgi:signal transduction histidine kinase
MLSPPAFGRCPATRAALLCLAALALLAVLVSAHWLAQSLSPSTHAGRLGAAALLLLGVATVCGWLWRSALASAPPAAHAPSAAADALRLSTAQSLALQTRLLRGLPGPALLVRTRGPAPQLLSCNSAAQATLPATDTPALTRLVHELLASSQPEDGPVRRLDLPGDCCVLWMPPSPPIPDPAPVVDEDRDALVYTVSHDLRAPIRVIEGFTRIVREDYGHLLDRVGNDHLERVLGAATRMNSMIDSLLALSRLSTQPIGQTPVDLTALATQVIEELRQQSPQRQAIIDIAPGMTAQGDPLLLRTVLENLLGNAWKYSARREISRITFGPTDTPGKTEYLVRDNGAGFDMRFASKLFGAFQRLHGATEFPGTGVGLASVRRIIRRHGGDIRAEAAVNEGACFYFTLG